MKSTTSFFLIDDDTDDTDLFQSLLSEVAPQVRFDAAENGLEAIEKLTSASIPLPDLIFLDLNMPKMNGKECLSLLKQNEQLRHIPVIMYTTSSQSKDIEETMLNGAICFIVKPSSLIELRNIIAAIAANVRGDLERTLRQLSETVSTFIVC